MEDFIIQIAREGLILVLLTSLPPLIASMGTGLIISVLQATTQIQEQTLTFVPKLVAVFAALAITGPWIGEQLVRFTHTLYTNFPGIF